MERVKIIRSRHYYIRGVQRYCIGNYIEKEEEEEENHR